MLPFYVMHQSVLIYLGYFVVRTGLPDPLKWLVIALSSLVLLAPLYELLVRRVGALRFLFGLTPAART